MKTITRFCVALVLAFAFSPTTRADVLFSQGVNPDGTYPNGGFNITGTDYPIYGYQSIASPFTLNADALLSRIDIGLVYIPEYSTFNRDIILKLEGNDPILGLPNGQVIASGMLTATAPLDNNLVAPTSFLLSNPNIALNGGETYWLIAEPADSTTVAVWTTMWTFYTDRAIARNANSLDGVSYVERYSYDFPTYQVIGTPVPEPSSLLLLFSGAPLFIRRRGTRAQGN